MKLLEALSAAKTARFQNQRTGTQSLAMAERCLRFLGPTRAASRVTAADLRRLVVAMVQTGLAPGTCNRHLSALSAVLEQAGAEVPIPWQREPKGRTRVLSAEEVTALAQASLPMAHGLAVSTLIRFLAETGLRVGEALALEWTDLELDGDRAGARVRTSKNGDARWVPLTGEAALAARTQQPLGVQGPWCCLSQSSFQHAFRAAREQVPTLRGQREAVPHALRHTAASRLVDAGISLGVVAAWLGHRDIKSTMRYTHPSEDGLLKAARMLETRGTYELARPSPDRG